jgi:negative regulator of flagellin synthesis FlgM
MKNVDSSMNIKPTRTDLDQGSPAAGRVSGRNKTDGQQSSAAPVTSGDKVTLTSTAADMVRLEENLARIPDVDDARVTAIKASIAEGSYQVDAEKVLRNLLDIEHELY